MKERVPLSTLPHELSKLTGKRPPGYRKCYNVALTAACRPKRRKRPLVHGTSDLPLIADTLCNEGYIPVIENQGDGRPVKPETNAPQPIESKTVRHRSRRSQIARPSPRKRRHDPQQRLPAPQRLCAERE